MSSMHVCFKRVYSGLGICVCKRQCKFALNILSGWRNWYCVLVTYAIDSNLLAALVLGQIC